MDIYINLICWFTIGASYTVVIYHLGTMKGLRDGRRIYKKAFNRIAILLHLNSQKLQGELFMLQALDSLQPEPRNEQPTKH